MNELYAAEHRKYERMHQVPGYSLGPGASYTREFMGHSDPGNSVIDFGCGTGDAGRILADHGFQVYLVDICKYPVRHADLPFFEAALPWLPEDLPRADWGFCTDVMEHLPEVWIDKALAAMKQKINRIFFSISLVPDGWGPAHIQEPLHLTVKPSAWWVDRIRKHWPDIAITASTSDTLVLIARDTLAIEGERRFDLIWSGEHYRQGSMELRMVPFILEQVQGATELNCHCVGTGRAIPKYVEAGITRISMSDVSGICLEESTRSLLGDDITFTQVSLWDLPEDFPRREWGVCIDALMCLPPDRLDDALAAVRRTCDNLIVEVYDWDYVRESVNYTWTIGDAGWWRKKLERYYRAVERHPAEAARRYIFVCKC